MASTPEEQDILLMATLTAASACVPNVYFRYGPTGKKYYANLQTFVLAASASGKGIANLALEMMRVVDRAYPMLIAGDSTQIGLLGENFHSAVVRMAVQVERIAMVLTAMRMGSGESNSPVKEERTRIPSGNPDNVILCSDEDFETAEMIGNKLLLHMAQAYRMIDGEGVELVPEVKPLDQRMVLFEQLPEEFASKVLVEEAKTQGISRRTALRWNDVWQEQGLVQQIKYGTYKKIA